MKAVKETFGEEGMVTALVRFRVKEGREDEFKERTRPLLLQTYPKDEGVIRTVP